MLSNIIISSHPTTPYGTWRERVWSKRFLEVLVPY